MSWRQCRKFGVASAIGFVVFPFVAPKSGYFQGIQFAPLLVIAGVVFEIVAFFMDLNHSEEGDADSRSVRPFGLHSLEPGDLLIAALVMSYFCLLVGGVLHYRRARISDLHRKVQHIDSGCKKIDDHVLELSEVFKRLSITSKNLESQRCPMCGSTTLLSLDIPKYAPVSISIKPENLRRDYHNSFQPRIGVSKHVAASVSPPISTDSKRTVSDAGQQSVKHYRSDNASIHERTQSVNDKECCGNIFSWLYVVFFFFPFISIWLIGRIMGFLNQS